MKAKRVAAYLVVTAVLLVVAVRVLSVQGDSMVSSSRSASPLALTPVHGIALGVIVVIAGGIVFFLNARYGPLITFTVKGQSQQSVVQSKQYSRSRSLIIVFIAAAVMVLLYQWLMSDRDRPSPSYEPPPREVSSFSFPSWIELFVPIGAGGAVVVSLVHLMLARYGVMPYNKQVRTVDPHEIASSSEPLPSNVQSLANELTDLGFVKLGHIGAFLPNGRELNQGLLFTSHEHTVAVWVGWAQWAGIPALTFSSYFPDSALLEMRYRSMLRINHPNYQASGNSESLIAAWEQHRRNLEAFSKQHGKPIPIDSTRSSLDWSKRTSQFHGHLYWQALDGQALAFPGAWLTINMALLSIILVLTTASHGHMGSVVLCVFPLIVMTLVPEILLVIGIARTLRKVTLSHLL